MDRSKKDEWIAFAKNTVRTKNIYLKDMAKPDEEEEEDARDGNDCVAVLLDILIGSLVSSNRIIRSVVNQTFVHLVPFLKYTHLSFLFSIIFSSDLSSFISVTTLPIENDEKDDNHDNDENNDNDENDSEEEDDHEEDEDEDENDDEEDEDDELNFSSESSYI